MLNFGFFSCMIKRVMTIMLFIILHMSIRASLLEKMSCTHIVILFNFFLHYLYVVLLQFVILMPAPPPLGCFLCLHLHKTYDFLHDIRVKIDK